MFRAYASFLLENPRWTDTDTESKKICASAAVLASLMAIHASVAFQRQSVKWLLLASVALQSNLLTWFVSRKLSTGMFQDSDFSLVVRSRITSVLWRKALRVGRVHFCSCDIWIIQESLSGDELCSKWKLITWRQQKVTVSSRITSARQKETLPKIYSHEWHQWQ